MTPEEAANLVWQLIKPTKNGSGYVTFGDQNIIFSNLVHSAQALADAYLREHDETPVTEEWLRSLGFEVTTELDGDKKWTWLATKSLQHELVSIGSHVFSWDIIIHPDRLTISCGQSYWPIGLDERNIVTRGEVRRLAELFGIKLKEQE